MLRSKSFILALVAVLIAAVPLRTVQAKDNAQRQMRKKLKTIILPRISFEDAPVSTVFDYLKQRSRQLDPDGVGVNFVLVLKPAQKTKGIKKTPKKSKKKGFEDEGAFTDEDFGDEDEVETVTTRLTEPTVTADFTNLPLGDAVRYICSLTKMRYKVDNHAVIILAPGVTQSNLELRFFSINPQLFKSLKDEDLKKFFEDKGVSFPTSTRR